MLRSYFKLILRNLLRNKVFSIINLSGLSIAIASLILIGLYVADEFSFDRHHQKGDRIYQMSIAANYDGQVAKWTGVPNKTAPALLQEVPEIERAVRILPNNFSGKAFVSSDKVKSSENRLVWADADIFRILTLPLLQGDSATALVRHNTVVVTEATARKYFGTLDVLGKRLHIDRDTADFEITGVMKNPPGNSRFQFPIIGASSGTWFERPDNQTWGNASFETYLLLHKNATAADVEKKIEQTLARNIAKEDRWFTLEIHPLEDIHLKNADIRDNGVASKGDMEQLMILMGLGFIILIIAAVNYMNLSTAQSQRRFKEIGISKTLGATRQQVVRKFYMETALFVALAIGISVTLAILSLPLFNAVTGKNFLPMHLTSGRFWVAGGCLWLLLTTLAGSYPAWYLSSFSPKQILKGSLPGLGSNTTLRKTLVVAQFSISSILIISTLILHQQLDYIQEKSLGYEPQQVIAIETTGADNRQQINAFRNALVSLPAISAVAQSQSYPGGTASGRNLPSLDSQNDDSPGTPLSTVRATPEILEVLGMKLLAGKTLPEKSDTDTTVQIVLNKTAVDILGLTPEEAVGRQLPGIFSGNVEVVGVTEDFHFSSLRQPIGAYCFHNAKTEGYNLLLVKLLSKDLTKSLADIEQTFKQNIPSAFQFVFLDQQLQVLYKSEQQLGNIVMLFSGLAIFIACLGLYALAAYTTEQRTKEIGIRKVMGASVLQLSTMLSRDFLQLVGLSFLLAVPIGYYIMNHWLEGFAYRIDIQVIVFVVAGILSVAIAWFTVGFEAFKAATCNPIESIRTE